MSRWQSHIDQILGDARARAAGQDSANKTASAPGVLDAAKEAADALDFVAHQDPGTGSSLRQFFVEKAALAPAVSPAMTTGEQAEPPRKTGKPAASPSGGSRPAVSGAPTGQMPVMPISQEGTSLVAKKATAAGAGMSPPAQHGLDWNPIARGPQDDPLTWSPGQWSPANAKVASQAEGTTLFDIVMQGRTASKEAMSPAQYVGGEDSGAAPSANEGSLTRFLASNEAAVGYTKRDAKLPTRARIKEVFQNVDDPANGEAARAAFPNASAKGGLKVAAGKIPPPVMSVAKKISPAAVAPRSWAPTRPPPAVPESVRSAASAAAKNWSSGLSKKAAVRFSEAGHKEQARRAEIIGKAAREVAAAQRDYMRENPLSANLRGHGSAALANELTARHMAYQKGKHSDKRQSLNPFGGLLTPLKKEGAIRFSEAGHKDETRQQKALVRMHQGLAESGRQFMVESPISANLRGRPAEALMHEMAARRAAYKVRKHSDKRQSLNPFGGLLTPVKDEGK